MMVNRKIKIFSSVEKIAKYSALQLQKQLSSDKEISVAVSGGSTPKNIYQYIAQNYAENIKWYNLKIYFGDERCVPSNNIESNFNMINKSLLSKINIPKENIFKINGENDPAKEAVSYENTLINNLSIKNGIPQFDIVMLGLGEDGHTASIFPDQINLFYSKKICETAVHPVTGQHRITITGEVINNAKLIIFFVTGENKAQIISEIFKSDEPNTKYPAALVKANESKVIWMLDNDSSKLLSKEIKYLSFIY